MPSNSFAAKLLLILLAAGSSAARADDFLSLETHAFLSQGFIKTTDNNYLANSRLGSFDFTEAGINFTKQLGDNMRTGMQLFSQSLGSNGGFTVNLDWFYFDYRSTDLLGIRFGRVKIPFGLYNDISDIDSARAPVLLPQSVYPESNRNFLLAQNGVEVYGYSGRGALGALDYRAYAGTISLDVSNIPGSVVKVQSLDVPYVAGARVLWETPVDGLRLGATLQALRLDTSLVYTGIPTPVSGEIPAVLWVGSAEYAYQKLLVAAEYSRWYVTTGDGSNATLFPDSSTTSERAYVMGAYRLTDWLQPALYYSVFFPNVEDRSGSQNQQHDISATLRFDINRFWLVKLEAHYMRGTAGLDSSLNGGAPLSGLVDSWGVFLVKTTAYF